MEPGGRGFFGGRVGSKMASKSICFGSKGKERKGQGREREGREREGKRKERTEKEREEKQRKRKGKERKGRVSNWFWRGGDVVLPEAV